MFYFRFKRFFSRCLRYCKKLFRKKAIFIDGDNALVNYPSVSLDDIKCKKVTQFFIMISAVEILLDKDHIKSRLDKITEGAKKLSKKIPIDVIITGYNRIDGLNELNDITHHFQVGDNANQQWNAFSLGSKLKNRCDQGIKILKEKLSINGVHFVKSPFAEKQIQLDYKNHSGWEPSILEVNKLIEPSSSLDDLLENIMRKKKWHKLLFAILIIFFVAINIKLLCFSPLKELEKSSKKLTQPTLAFNKRTTVFDQTIVLAKQKNSFLFYNKYRRLLRKFALFGENKIVLPVIGDLEYRLEKYSREWPLLVRNKDILQDYLQIYFTYLLFSSPHINKQLYIDSMTNYMKKHFDVDGDLSKTIDFLLDHKQGGWAISAQLLNQAKSNLEHTSIHQRTLLIMQRIFSGKKNVGVEDLVSNGLFSSNHIDGFFLSQWDPDLKNSAENILSILSKDHLNYEIDAVRELFMTQREHAWHDFIRSIKPFPADSLFAIDAQLNNLLNNKDQLRNIIDFIRDNYPGDVAFVDQLLGDQSLFLKNYFSIIENMHKNIKQLAFSKEKNHEFDDVSYFLDLLDPHDSDLAHAIQMWLRSPIDNVEHYFSKEHEKKLKQKWNDKIYSYYQANISGFYPFAKKGPNLSLEKLHYFIHPDSGIFSPGGNSWPQSLKANITNLNLMANGLFRDKKHFGFPWAMRPDPMPGIQEIVLQVGDKVIHYQNGPQEWSQLTWSSEDSEIGLYVYDDQHQLIFEAQSQGPWGLYQLMEQGTVDYLDKQNLLVTWSIDKIKKVRMRIKLDDKGAFYLLREKHFGIDRYESI